MAGHLRQWRGRQLGTSQAVGHGNGLVGGILMVPPDD
jgi:hypothetical protein